MEQGRDVRLPKPKKESRKLTSKERKAYTDLVHSYGGKTLGDLLEEQKKKGKAK